MKKTRKLVSLLLALCLLAGCLPMGASAATVSAATIVANAESLAGKYPKYVSGGSSPSAGGFDCTGFVYYVFNQMSGVDISLATLRSKSSLAKAGTKITGTSNFLPGDIIQGSTSSSLHVGICVGNGMMVDCGSSKGVSKRSYINQTWFTIDYAVRLPGITQGGSAHTTHTWNSGAVTKAATCGTAGTKTYTCTVCGTTKTEMIPKTYAHTWDSGTITAYPTVNNTGTKRYVCTVCGETKTEVLPQKLIQEYTLTTGKKIYKNGEKVIFSWNPIEGAVKYYAALYGFLGRPGPGEYIETHYKEGMYSVEFEYSGKNETIELELYATASEGYGNAVARKTEYISFNETGEEINTIILTKGKSSYTAGETVAFSWKPVSYATRYHVELSKLDPVTGEYVLTEDYKWGSLIDRRNERSFENLQEGSYLFHLFASDEGSEIRLAEKDILFEVEGVPDEPDEPDEPDPPAPAFTDVEPGAFYEDAVKWAVEKGITKGTSKDKFSPMQTCNRGQAVTFLWRAAGSPEPSSSVNPFTDVKPEDFFYKAVLWAVEKGITKGTSKDKFSPNKDCDRGTIVTFQYRAAGSPAVSAGSSFTDVSAGQFYTDAVAWAVQKGITKGTSATKFSPVQECNRGQIVTFLYRGK